MPAVNEVIGPDGGPVLWWQMVIRAVVVFFFLLVLIRLGDRRAFARISAFDIVIGMVLGSMLSRALTANAPFVPTLASSAALVALHAALSKAAMYSTWAGAALKGRKVQLVADGRMLPEGMRHTNITERDLIEALRTNAAQADLSGIKAAYLERSGEISFVR